MSKVKIFRDLPIGSSTSPPSPPLKKSRLNSSSSLRIRRPLSDVSPNACFTTPVSKGTKGNQSQRIALSEKSPNAVSTPVKIPLISVQSHQADENDEVFSDAQGFVSSNSYLRQPNLFPSFGTSPSHGLLLDCKSPGRTFRSMRKSDMEFNAKKLGKGSYGTVILGVWKKERVAMKIICRRSSLDNERNAELLDHENITKIKAVVEEWNDLKDPKAMIIMEYVGQRTLQALIEKALIEKNELAFQLSLSFMKQICQGLNHCHSKLIAHLDLKPSNVLVSSRGLCKLADFGCSARLSHSNETRLVEKIPGTPGYQAPELLKAKKVCLKSDIFSLGVVFWQIVACEKQPFPGWHPHTIIFRVAAQDARPDKEPPSIWSGHRDLYQACWSTRSDIRPTAREVLLILTKLENQKGSSRKSSSAMRI